MLRGRVLIPSLFFLLATILVNGEAVRAQTAETQGGVFHRIEGRVQYRTDGVGNLRVRLVREMRPLAETFTRPEGQFVFNMVREGDYIIETFDTENFEASSTNVPVRPIIRGRPEVFRVFVDIQLKAAPDRMAPGVLAADVDLKVPKDAQKNYRAGMKALNDGDLAGGIKSLKKAVELFPSYYAARLAWGQEMRKQKRYEEAAEVLEPLGQIAPRRAEPRIARAAALLALEDREKAIQELRVAVHLEENNWEGQFYLGWALLEVNGTEAELHLKRALDLDERKAVRAHLALARLAHSQSQRQLAIQHLDIFLALAPDSNDAESARVLVAHLRSGP
jgi:tetratricopeptide (TPR) repeat protein